MAKNPITPEIAIEMWNWKLDEYSLTDIHAFWGDGATRAQVKEVLDRPVPEYFKNDDRCLPFYHAWLSLSGAGCPDSAGKPAAFLVARIPKGRPAAEYRKNLSAIRRALVADHPGAKVEFDMADRIDNEAAHRFAVVRSFPAYAIAEDGTGRKLTEEDFAGLVPPYPEAGPEGPGGP